MNASNPRENIMSQEILKISLGRFGVKDNWNDSIAILVVRYKATYLILYPLLANILNQSKDIAPAGPPPINPTHALLGENLSPIYPPFRYKLPGSTSLGW